jgi:hypothetical protein
MIMVLGGLSDGGDGVTMVCYLCLTPLLTLSRQKVRSTVTPCHTVTTCGFVSPIPSLSKVKTEPLT